MMYDFKEIIDYLSKNLNKDRFEHTLRVEEMGIILCNKHGFKDINKIRVACLLHDICKHMNKDCIIELLKSENVILEMEEIENYKIFHGIAGAIFSKNKFNIDNQVFSAIKNHVTGNVNMSIFDKIVFLADYIEYGRNFEEVELIRDICFRDLDEGMLISYNNTIKFLLHKNMYIHKNTINGRNFILKYLKGRNL